MTSSRTSREVRESVGHPIIDADGHLLELVEAAVPYLRRYLGDDGVERWRRQGSAMRSTQAAMSLEERRRTRTPQGAWWGTHTRNVLDRATASLPALLHERMDELGLDYSVLYPTNTLATCAVEDDELRRGLCTGFNHFSSELLAPYADRLTAAGMIPMHTPEEAIAELEHCADLGVKVVAFPEGVRRPMAEPARPGSSLWLYPGQTHWFDLFGLDSEHDYDPVWARAYELGYAVTFHGGLSPRPGTCTFISSYSANHIGMFAASMQAVCKALFMGGVTRRLPEVPFVFLECGVSWAAQMLADAVEHWEKRRLDALAAFDPAALDRDALAGYVARYGGQLLELLGDEDPVAVMERLAIHGGAPEDHDEWAALDVGSEDELVERFVGSFYFGCEADDRGIPAAFSPANVGGAQLRPVLSSDIGHWDVTDIAEVVAESYGFVDEGLITPEQYRQLTFTNGASMFLRADPGFFDGTPVAPHVPALLAELAPSPGTAGPDGAAGSNGGAGPTGAAPARAAAG